MRQLKAKSKLEKCRYKRCTWKKTLPVEKPWYCVKHVDKIAVYTDGNTEYIYPLIKPIPDTGTTLVEIPDDMPITHTSYPTLLAEAPIDDMHLLSESAERSVKQSETPPTLWQRIKSWMLIDKWK